MNKYLRLLRLQDQYLQIGAVLCAGIFNHLKDWRIFEWALAMTLFSFTAFIVNEFTDREDTDKYSWNRDHIQSGETFDLKIVVAMFTTFSLVGLYFSYQLHLFWLGLACYLTGVLYSLKPIRFKSRFVLDILAQGFVFFVIPFLGPAVLSGRLTSAWLLTFVLFCLIWSESYPYQLADFQADVRAKLRGTHVILGMKKSLILGIVLMILSWGLFFLSHLYTQAPFLWPFIIISPGIFLSYLFWLKMNDLKKQTESMQKYVAIVKPLSQFLIPVFLVWLYLI